jgi:hypothetical protein
MIGVMLLTMDDKYLTKDGELPYRPDCDKLFLYGMCANKPILCSENTRDMLPRTLIGICKAVDLEYDKSKHNEYVNLGVSTYDIWPETLFIVRSKTIAVRGKTFRYRHKYSLKDAYLVDKLIIEEWIRNDTRIKSGV